MRRHEEYDGLEAFVRARGDDLMRLCALLAGSRAGGEDLFQQALERLLKHWGRIDGDPEGYLRRIVYRLAVDTWRSRGRRPESLRGELPELAAPDAHGEVDLRDALARAIAKLPARQRAIVVLRYWERLSEAETAAALGCSIGTVKSAGSRGLAQLRSTIDPRDLERTRP